MILPQAKVMIWLRHGVPIALLADLLEPGGPASHEIYRYEAVDDDVRQAALAAARAELASAADDFSARRADW